MKHQAPRDADADKLYDSIMQQARGMGLIVQAAGGVATIAIPSEQRKAGIRERVLAMDQLEELPINLEEDKR